MLITPEPAATGEKHAFKNLIRERMKAFIVDEKLKPGDKLPTEEVLCERLQISRSALREALASLEALGMIEARQGSGRVVRDFNFDAILSNLAYGFVIRRQTRQHIKDVRKALDLFFIESIVMVATEAQIEELRQKVRDIQQKMRNKDSYVKEDYELHRAMFAITGNPLAQQLFEITWDANLHIDDGDGTPPRQASRRHELSTHSNIVEAIALRDIVGARMAVLAHYKHMDRVLSSES
ncbi:MAG: FadR family transcriptional regulator [Anaerolineae bacterium]|nr:FadR family transcriptional regulator [Anaerolineae bacterium]